jgi:ABC-2 type transport system permease protein
MKVFLDTWLIFHRQLLLVLRQPVWILVGIFQPVMYLLLFTPLLQPALQGPLGVQSQADAYRVFVPGLLVFIAIFSGLFQGFGLIAELRAGVVDRSRVTPISRVAMLFGRSLRDAVILVVQATIITVLAMFFGLSVGVIDLLLAYLLLALIALMTSAVSYGVSLKLPDENALGPLMNTIAQPVLLLSGILLPLTLAPAWLQTTAEFNPFAWAVDGIRALFSGDVDNPLVWQSLLIIGLLAALATGLAARAFAHDVR